MKKLIRVRRTSNSTAVFEKDANAIDSKLKKAGYFCILTTEHMSADTALSIYRSRDAVERLFNCVKNDLGFTRAEVKNDETLQGKVFCVMISAMVATVFRNCLRENRIEFTRKMTYNKFIKELDGVYCHEVKKKKIWCEISKRQLLIFDKLGIDSPVAKLTVNKKRAYVKKKS